MFKYYPWLTESLLALLMVVLFGIIGTMERLPPEQEAKLEAWRRGDDAIVMARGK